MYKSEQ